MRIMCVVAETVEFYCCLVGVHFASLREYCLSIGGGDGRSIEFYYCSTVKFIDDSVCSLSCLCASQCPLLLIFGLTIRSLVLTVSI